MAFIIPNFVSNYSYIRMEKVFYATEALGTFNSSILTSSIKMLISLCESCFVSIFKRRLLIDCPKLSHTALDSRTPSTLVQFLLEKKECFIQ